MKEFLKTNTVTYNLISFTAFKSMLIFSLLAEGPKTYEEIQEFLEDNEFLREKVSIDTVRVYINTLKSLGCNVIVTKQGRKNFYHIDSHPFELKISDAQVKSVIKVLKAIGESVELEDYLAIQSFIEKFSRYITNDSLKEKIKKMSPLYNISPELVKDLMKYTKNKSLINVMYRSPKSGDKLICIICDTLKILRNQLYLYGFNNEHRNYSSFLVSKILKIVSVNISKTDAEPEEFDVVYELTNISDFIPADCEKIISQSDDKIVIEICSKNKFDIIQRILSYAQNCKVVSPNNFRKEIVECLKKMKEGYLGEE